MKIDCAFPGGNIVVERIQEREVWLHQDLRDTGGDWFYWFFRVAEAGGKTIRFHFTESPALGAHGPAISTDGGETWRWLGAQCVEGNSFTCSFEEGSESVFLSMTIPYTGKSWADFLSSVPSAHLIRQKTLCRSRNGRPVESVHIGCLKAVPRHRILLVARHHCCESMASYVMEGVAAYFLGAEEPARWFQKQVECWIVPFMDKDGVEEGDQGKNRIPRDHNRDYDGDSLYPETKALRLQIPEWSEGRLRLALDLHCPWLCGGLNEIIYLVGSASTDVWREQQRFSGILGALCRDSLPFRSVDNLAYGKDWNVESNFSQGKSFSNWASELQDCRLASTLEIPYANARGVEVNATSARLFGRDLARAIICYLQTEADSTPG